MAILTREDFFARLENRLGHDTSDEAIAFLEDMTDTYNDLEMRASNNTSEDWKKKYEELDESWKKRYRHRFFSGDSRGIPEGEGTANETEDYEPEEVKVEDLFIEKKEDK